MSSESPDKDRLKIVFDTNIYISAFLKSGFSRELLNCALEEKFEIFCSSAILSELENKLRKKFKIIDQDINLFILTISKVVKVVSPSQKLMIVKVDPQDNIILECALAAEASLIISLDKHLLKLKKFQKIGIVHPKTFRWILPDIFKK